MDIYDLGCMLSDTLDLEKIARDVLSDTDDHELSEYAFAASIGEDHEDVDFEDPETQSEYSDFLLPFTVDLVDTALDDVLEGLQIHDGLVRVWRSIAVPSDWLENEAHARPLGVCWSFEEDAAECHWGDFSECREEIRVEALVDPSHVNWAGSIYCNTRMGEEKEIRLSHTAVVDVVGAKWISRRDGRQSIADIATGVYAAGDGASVEAPLLSAT